MNVDALIVGSGIQGLILTKYLKEQGMNCKCVSNCSIGGEQTLSSQFYLHRGHFYSDTDLAFVLNRTYANWVSLIKELKISYKSDQSYIGFSTYDEEKYWVKLWERAQLPYKKKKYPNWPEYLKESRGYSFYKIPHLLFSGQHLINSLTNRILKDLLFGSIKEISNTGNSFSEVIISNNNNLKSITAKYVVLCAGAGNLDLTRVINAPSQKIPEMQKRSCLMLVLEGNLPNASILLPGLKIFISPQYNRGRVYWLYTYGTDPIIRDEIDLVASDRLKKQLPRCLINKSHRSGVKKWC